MEALDGGDRVGESVEEARSWSLRRPATVERASDGRSGCDDGGIAGGDSGEGKERGNYHRVGTRK